MKCEHCEKPATFHITELTGNQPQEVHLCEDHARDYLTQSEVAEVEGSSTIAGALAQHLKVGQTAEELSRLDQRACPVCGITFFEFRNHGRLGCPHDYDCFSEELEPLLINIHGATEHTGKRPRHLPRDASNAHELIRMRRELKEAIDREEYELASELRDRIREIEGRPGPESSGSEAEQG